MKNFEKYEKVLNKYKEGFGVSKDTGRIIDCNWGGHCDICKFNNNDGYDLCGERKKEWLNEKCNLLLTDDEREYLRLVIKPCRDHVRCIYKHNGVLHIELIDEEPQSIDISMRYTFKFKGLIGLEKYSLELLDL